jgi:protein-S-isoprenylcysteine O-methyltransferase Ste14
VTEPADRPGIIAPPPLLTLAAIGLALLLDHYYHLPLLPSGWDRARIPLATFLGAAGVVLLIAGNVKFRRLGTTPNPYRPSTVVVSSGVFAFTRNPMYVAFLAFVGAVTVGRNTLWGIVAVVALFVILHFGVVKREERYLSAKFGATYEEYRQTVRRWI